MKITDALLGEHSAFYMLFDQVEEIATIEGAMGQIRGATTVLAAMVESHATLEEELLFTALEPHMGRDVGPVAQMRADHEELEHLLGQIEEAEDVAQATTLVAQVLSAARNHFRKEEQFLFPMAEKLLGDETLTRLGEAWAGARGVVIA